jgi:hypothetical protein
LTVSVLILLLASEALAVPPPDFAKRVPTPNFVARVPVPMFPVVVAQTSVGTVAVKPLFPRLTAARVERKATRTIRVCDGKSCRVIEVPIEVEAVKPAGVADKKAGGVAPAPSASAGSCGCAGGDCRPAIRIGRWRR